jgi:hypothetical protein
MVGCFVRMGNRFVKRREEGEGTVRHRGKEKTNFMSYIANRLQSTITCMSHHLLICFHGSMAPSRPIPSHRHFPPTQSETLPPVKKGKKVPSSWSISIHQTYPLPFQHRTKERTSLHSPIKEDLLNKKPPLINILSCSAHTHTNLSNRSKSQKKEKCNTSVCKCSR